jgi:hypothetical protein
MNYQLKAALAAVALTIVPGIVFAGAQTGWMVATDFRSPTSELTGVTQSWSTSTVRHIRSTQNQFIGDPHIIPAGPCRSIAIKWNMGVYTDKSRTFFLRQMGLAAQFNCNFTFTRSDEPNALGSYDLLSIAPSK